MSKEIFIEPDELSSRLLKKARDELADVADRLAEVDCSPLFSEFTKQYIQMSASDIATGLNNRKKSLSSIQRKLRQYAKILDTGPDEICDIDARCKNDLTNWWDRATYEDGWLAKFAGNDLKTSGACYVNGDDVQDEFLGVGATSGYGVSALYYEARVENSGGWDIGEGEVGIGTEVSVKGGLAKVSREASYGALTMNRELEVGVAAFEGKAGFRLMNDGKFDPGINVGAKAYAEGISISGENQLGSEDFNVHGKSKVTAGYAEAEVEASIGRDGVDIEAEVGAAAVRGEASAGFTVFGVKIDLTAEGSLLSAEAGGGVEMDKDSIELGGKLGLLVGLGLNLKISW